MERQRKTFAQLIIEKIVMRKNMAKKLQKSANDQDTRRHEPMYYYEAYGYDYIDCHQDYFDANPE